MFNLLGMIYYQYNIALYISAQCGILFQTGLALLNISFNLLSIYFDVYGVD